MDYVLCAMKSPGLGAEPAPDSLAAHLSAELDPSVCERFATNVIAGRAETPPDTPEFHELRQTPGSFLGASMRMKRGSYKEF